MFAEMAECPLVNALVAQYLAQVAPKVATKFTKQMQVSCSLNPLLFGPLPDP